MSKVKAVPDGMHTVTPVLKLKGCAEAMEFFHKAFGAETLMKELDPSGKLVWHAMMKLGDSMIMMNDAMEDMGEKAHPTDIWLYVENVDAAWKRAVDAGATAAMPPADMFWGDRFGKVVDKWGNGWGIATHVKDMTDDEMKKAQAEFVASMPPQKK